MVRCTVAPGRVLCASWRSGRSCTFRGSTLSCLCPLAPICGVLPWRLSLELGGMSASVHLSRGVGVWEWKAGVGSSSKGRSQGSCAVAWFSLASSGRIRMFSVRTNIYRKTEGTQICTCQGGCAPIAVEILFLPVHRWASRFRVRVGVDRPLFLSTYLPGCCRTRTFLSFEVLYRSSVLTSFVALPNPSFEFAPAARCGDVPPAAPCPSF